MEWKPEFEEGVRERAGASAEKWRNLPEEQLCK